MLRQRSATIAADETRVYTYRRRPGGFPFVKWHHIGSKFMRKQLECSAKGKDLLMKTDSS
jgi:hypothetical protein